MSPGRTAAGAVSRLAWDRAAAAVLWRRDLVRFFRQRNRVTGAIGQPLMFWLLIGSGLGASFKPGGSES